MARLLHLDASTRWPGGPVPAPGPGVCARCHGPARDGAPECWCCRRVGAVLGEAPGTGPPATALALCRPGDALHGALRRYKDAPAVEARRHHVALLGAMLSDFFAHGAEGLRAGHGAWQAVAVVPSSARGSATTAPFMNVVDSVVSLRGTARVALRRGPGRAGHLAPARDAFRLLGPPPDGGVLLLDDTWVTGARARSAAANRVRQFLTGKYQRLRSV